MKKVVLFFPLFIFFIIISITTILAANGDICRQNGGQCRTACQQGERDDGNWDCSQAGITGGQTCCFPVSVTPPQKSCGESCVNTSQCPSQCNACQELVQGQGKVCRVAGGVSPAPGPGGGEAGSIRTAIGDIDPRNLQGFIQQLLGLAFGVAGGIAFLLMLFGSFQIMTSSGNPEKMKAGSELITSALTGLLFIVFSVFLLKLIGVTILDIPGFGK